MAAIKLELDENIKVSNSIVNFLQPEKIVLPVSTTKEYSQNFIYKWEEITDTVISPISGKITIGDNNVTIINDYRELRQDDSGVNKILPQYNIAKLTKILSEISNAKFKNQKQLIINAMATIPYDVTNIFLFRENLYLLLETANAIKNTFNYSKVTIFVSANYADIISKILNVLGTFPNFELKILGTLYPLHNNKALNYYLNEKKNVTKAFITLYELYDLGFYLKRNIFPTEKLITISGDMVETPIVVYSKIGVLLTEILHVIKLKRGEKHYILNNIMSGEEIDINNYYINSQTSAILIMKNNEITKTDCINCGLCLKICPLKTTANSKICIKCNLCSYACPSKKDLLKE